MLIPITYNVRNLLVRRTTTIMTALGVALTVAVMLGVGTLVEGLRTSLVAGGDPLHLIVMRQGSTAELVSIVSKEDFDVIKFSPGIAKRDGEPMASHEVVSVVNLPMRGNASSEANISVRGLSPMGINLRHDVELLEGRWFTPGKREMVVGRGVKGKRAGTDIGDTIFYGRGDWDVVGVFSAGQSSFNSEIWVDANLAGADLGRGSSLSSVLVRAEDSAAAAALQNLVADDQRLGLEAERESEYYAKQMVSADPIRYLGMFVAVIMAIGSCFAAMNTMFAAVANRAHEIGVLRLLGFSRTSVLSSFVLESLLLSILGGLLGCVLVLPLNGLEGRIGNFVTFSETTFQFRLTLDYVVGGLLFAATMGIMGGLLPAWLAARRQVLRSLGDR